MAEQDLLATLRASVETAAAPALKPVPDGVRDYVSSLSGGTREMVIQSLAGEGFDVSVLTEPEPEPEPEPVTEATPAPEPVKAAPAQEREPAPKKRGRPKKIDPMAERIALALERIATAMEQDG